LTQSVAYLGLASHLQCYPDFVVCATCGLATPMWKINGPIVERRHFFTVTLRFETESSQFSREFYKELI